MGFRRVAGLTFGYGLLAIALLAGVNALRIAALGLLGSLLRTDAAFFTMVNFGTAIVVGTGGYVVLQRVRRTGAGYGVESRLGARARSLSPSDFGLERVSRTF